MRREERTLVIAGTTALVVLLGMASVMGLRTAREPDKAPTPEAFSDGVREMPFGPFLFVPPGSTADGTRRGGDSAVVEVTDRAALAASAYLVQLPPPYTQSAIAGKADGSEIMEVGTDWDGPGGVHVRVTMSKVDPSQLPVQVEWLPITSHLFVRQKVINGRYAAVKRPSTCGEEKGGSVTVWMDGATLTLASVDAPADDLVALVSKITTPGTLY